MQFSLIALLSTGLASLAAAYTTPVGANPSGNPILTPSLGEIVPVGVPYTIKWEPTSQSTVTLVLLRGPSANIKPLYPIVQNIPNLGSYRWTPSTDLVADTTGYGIQLIEDATGAYQYTSQFGISNSNPTTPTAASSTTSSTSTSLTGSSVSALAVSSGTSSYTAGNTTSTVFSTQLYTVISCASTVKNCPASSTAVVTSVIAVSTTVCPVANATSTGYFPYGNGTTSTPYLSTGSVSATSTSPMTPYGNLTIATTTTSAVLTTSTLATTTAPSGTQASSSPISSSGAGPRQAASMGGLAGGAGMLLALLL